MLRAAKEQARKRDTRDKIQLGGLIVKAGMRLQPRALILGILLDGQKRLVGDASERTRLLQLGAEGFAKDGTDNDAVASTDYDVGASSTSTDD